MPGGRGGYLRGTAVPQTFTRARLLPRVGGGDPEQRRRLPGTAGPQARVHGVGTDCSLALRWPGWARPTTSRPSSPNGFTGGDPLPRQLHDRAQHLLLGRLRSPHRRDLLPLDRRHHRDLRHLGTTGAGTRVSVTNGSATVGGLLGTTWRASNRGRGDVITIPCDDPPACLNGASPDGVHYMVLGVAADDSLQLSQGYLGPTNAERQLPHSPAVRDSARLGGLHLRRRPRLQQLLPGDGREPGRPKTAARSGSPTRTSSTTPART